MRVCLLVPVLDVFKGANHLPLLAACKDVQFTILTNRTKPVNASLPANVTVETLHARLGPYYHGIADTLFARAVLKKYPAKSPFWKQFNVIHLNQTMGPALLQLKKTGVPMLLLIHHPVSVDRSIAMEESSFFRGILWRVKYAFLTRWQRKFCREMANIATVSQTSADRIASDYNCEREKIHVVPNGVDGTVFVPGDLPKADYDVIALGSLIHPRKGFRYLVDAYRALAAKGYRIADVGRRTTPQRQILQSIPGVTTIGTVPHAKLIELIQRSVVLISASLYEGFGLSLIEALACGRPAIAFDGGAVGEVLNPIDRNLLVPVRDTDALVTRVTDFLQLSKDEQAQKGRAYRDDVMRLYGLDHSAETLEAVYTKLMASA